jgi:hypothetical protein
MTTKKTTTKKNSSKKEEQKIEQSSRYSIDNTDKEIIFNYIDDFSEGTKLGIANDVTNEESKKEQIDFVDAFVLDFKSKINEGDTLMEISRFNSEFISGLAELIMKHKSSEKDGKVYDKKAMDFEFVSITGINENEKVEPTSTETVIDFSGFDTIEKSTNPKIGMIGKSINTPKIGMIGVENNLLPYCLHIKNLTDEKLYGVDLFNYDHEKQNKVAYSCTNGVLYDRFLGFLSALSEAKEEIRLIRFTADCDYNKFKSKQLKSCVHTIYSEPNGSMVSMPTNLIVYLSAYQFQSDIIDVPFSGESRIKLFNQLQLRLSYLMPETEMYITIFPSKINE